MEMQITLLTEGRDETSLEYQVKIRLIQRKIKKTVMSYINEKKTSSLYIFASVFHIFIINNISIYCGFIRRNKENI